MQLVRSLEHISLLLGRTGTHQHSLVRHSQTNGEQRLEHCLVGIIAKTANFACRRHINAEHRVGTAETRERELRSLDTYVVEVEGTLGRLLNRQAEHDTSGKVDKVDFEYLRHEGEASRCTEVALNHLDIIILGKELDVERTGNIESFSNRSRHLLDAAHCLDVEFLRRELDSSVTTVHTGKLNMLGDSISLYFAMVGNGIHFYFLGVLHELCYNYRVLFRHIGSEFEEALKFVGIRAYVHCRAREHIAGTDKHGIAYLFYKLLDIGKVGKFAPAGLVDTEAVEHSRELVAVFGAVDAFCRGTEYMHSGTVESGGEVIWNLAAHRKNNTVGILHFEDIHYTFVSEFVEVEAVADVVVGRYCLGVVVNHYRSPALATSSKQGVDRAPVEFYRRTDTVCARTEHDNRASVAGIFYIILSTIICKVEIVCSCRVLCGKGIDLFYNRYNAERFTVGSHLCHIGVGIGGKRFFEY